jgi:hypothetical protein
MEGAARVARQKAIVAGLERAADIRTLGVALALFGTMREAQAEAEAYLSCEETVDAAARLAPTFMNRNGECRSHQPPVPTPSFFARSRKLRSGPGALGPATDATSIDRGVIVGRGGTGMRVIRCQRPKPVGLFTRPDGTIETSKRLWLLVPRGTGDVNRLGSLHWRNRAKEARILAAQMKDDLCIQLMPRIARDSEALARGSKSARDGN